MEYNYHTHTYLCEHATGTMEEYVTRAISCGICYMGFSEHAPFVCADGGESFYRLKMSDRAAYVSEVMRLKEKYSGQIDIKIGLEMEYYPEKFDTMLKTALDMGVEYLILGEHFCDDESTGVQYSSVATDSEEEFVKHISTVIEGMKTGYFTYVAHPDIFNFSGDKKLYAEQMKRLCDTSAKCKIPLEINFMGIRQSRNYPCEDFWKIAGESCSPVTLGCDAHSAVDAFDGESLKKAKELIQKYKLNYIGKPGLVML